VALQRGCVTKHSVRDVPLHRKHHEEPGNERLRQSKRLARQLTASIGSEDVLLVAGLLDETGR
jgi:hypothetical protein